MRIITPMRSAALLLVVLAGCSAGPGGSGKEGAAADVSVGSDSRPAAQLAYSYSYQFRLPSDVLVEAQRRHLALCVRLGPQRCRMLSTHGGADGARAGGSTRFELASDSARQFGDALVQPVRALGGTLQTSDVTAEDLSRQIVDLGARVRAKEALAARLMQALQTRVGTTADLVATEKAVAEVQEQLDAVRTALAQARGRIATSQVDVQYEGAPTFAGETGAALRSVREVFSTSVAALIYALAAAVPWVVSLTAIFVVVRRLVRWIRARRRRQPA